jgi:two-component system, NtrC family, response regulator HydG
MKPRILIVDDNQDFARGVALALEDLSTDVTLAHSAEEALERMDADPADLLFSDVRMPGMDGLALLDEVDRRWPRTRMVLFTGHGTIESAVRAMKQGATDYLSKPVDHDELLLVATRAWKELLDQDELARLRSELRKDLCFHGICSRDPRMRPVLAAIRRVAPASATVMIYGESGTGKELVARAIHAESPRADRPFVAFNAAALSESLAEAELFGARKGAYTGSDRDRKGLFVEAHGGTLFIDEVASMPASLQGKLLRAVQEREVLPVGAGTPVKVDTRIVVATNVEPQRLLASGLLRKDLYYRLAVVRIHIPPLRDRVEDIPLLANLFLEHANAERAAVEPGCAPRTLAPRAMRLLLTHDWPGNVRELQNVMERAAVMCTGDEIGPLDILFEDDALDASGSTDEGILYEDAKREVLERFQRRYVERALAETGGNLSAAARNAGITRAALHRIVKRLGIEAIDADELLTH